MFEQAFIDAGVRSRQPWTMAVSATGLPAPPAKPAPPVDVKKPAPAPSAPVRVGSGVQAARLIYQVKPVYPPLAWQARVSGTVKAATEAVSQWRYQPTRLNGEPVEVVTLVEVHFILSQ